MARSGRRTVIRWRAVLLLVAIFAASTAGAFHDDVLPRLHDGSHELTAQGDGAASKQPCVACALTHTPALSATALSIVDGVAPDAGLLQVEQTHALTSSVSSSHGSRAPPFHG